MQKGRYSYRVKEYCLIFIMLLVGGATFSQDTIPSGASLLDTLKLGESKSGYDKISSVGGVNSVGADLILDDGLKMSWLDVDVSKRLFNKYYGFKRKLKDKTRIAVGTDYMLLNQMASFSYSDKWASSGIFRFYGSWEAFNTNNGLHGSLIVKVENRHKIGTSQLPRQLGYEAGSALSTASFKDFGWGLTNFYWKQFFGNKFALVAGIMDVGDWVDLYPLLNAYKFYLNEAFFNNPAMALPNQGFGISGEITIADYFYISGGIHDANGEASYFIAENFKSFFNQQEYFYWIEFGWSPSKSLISGQTIHLSYWNQDARKDKGIEKSQGWCFSASYDFSGITPFFRTGISEGNAALMHHLVMLGADVNIYRGDNLGIGLSWGGPSDRRHRDQYGMEFYYGIQLTEHLNIMPDLQLTINPSFNESKDIVGVFSTIRLRYAI